MKVLKNNLKFDTDSFSFIDLTFEQLIDSDFHLGSRFGIIHNLNFKYMFSKRFDLAIINLAYSLYNLKMAVYFISFVVSMRGKVLFFDNFEGTRSLVEFIGLSSKQYYINQKWIAGLLTNFKNFYPAVFSGVSRHFRFYQTKYKGMRYIQRPPNVFCCLNIERGSSAFYENFRLGIPIVALINSNTSISGAAFPIFSNNVSSNTFSTFFSILRGAVLNGYKFEVYKFFRKYLKKKIRERFVSASKKYKLRKRSQNLLKNMGLYLVLKHRFLIFKFLNFLVSLFKSNKENSNYLKIFTFFFLTKFFFMLELENFSSSFFIKVEKLRELLNLFSNFLFKGHSFSLFFTYLLNEFSLAFYSTNIYIVFSFFYNQFLPFFKHLFSLFLKYENSPIDFSSFLKSFNLFLLCFNISYLAKGLYNVSKKGGVMINPFSFWFNFPKKKNLFFGKLLAKIHKFSVTDFNLFFRSRFFNSKYITLMIFDFRKNYHSFKCMTYFKKYKFFFRVFFKCLKFYAYIIKPLYNKHSKKLVFDKINSKYVRLSKKFVSLNRETSFFKSRFFLNYSPSGKILKRNIMNKNLTLKFKRILVKYFDEEYEDFKFPLNDEFFYFHAAYGSAFIERLNSRNKYLASKKYSAERIFKRHKTFLKLNKRIKGWRFALYSRINDKKTS